ncbi:hypothetical protein BGZ76_009265 [Entomortierella beljakovae]|nr:hypothetical protein BGZ76_009265 [Entomortierella beljakovae]
MPNYVSLTESQRRKIAVFITESQQQAQLLQQQQQQQIQQQQQQQANNNGDDSVISSSSLTGSPGGSNTTTTPITGANSISCKEIVQFCKTRFGLTISLSTASRLRSTATERLSTELLNPSAKRHRSVKFPEFEKALVQELKALEQEQMQIQQELNPDTSVFVDPAQIPPVMTLTSEAAITQVAKGIAERMGIPPVELGLTSGWYHGFKRRHGIKHRQFKSRSTPIVAGGGLVNSGQNSSSMETGDSSDGPDGGDGVDIGDVVDGDEEMEDIQDFGDTTVETKLPVTPKEPPASSLSRRPEVKKVTAAAGNDALDVISEYLLQNGQIGATKLPLVKELRKFLLSQTELENGTSNDNNVPANVGASTLAPGPSNSGD